MLLQEFSVVVNKIRYGVLSQYIIANLCLHEAKLFGYVLLQQMRKFLIPYTATHIKDVVTKGLVCCTPHQAVQEKALERPARLEGFVRECFVLAKSPRGKILTPVATVPSVHGSATETSLSAKPFNESRMQLHFHANRSHFHKNGFALGLALKQRHKGTRKWPVDTSGPGCSKPS